MMLAPLFLATSLAIPAGLPPLQNAMPIRVVGPWSIEIGPGSVQVDNREIRLDEPKRIEIPPLAIQHITGEQHAKVPSFNPEAGGWMKGARLKALITQECTATGALYPATLKVRSLSDPQCLYAQGRDYEADTFWGTFGRIEDGRIPAEEEVLVDYDYSPCRLDSIVVDAGGQVRLIEGAPGLGAMAAPALSEGETAIASIWLISQTESVTNENLYPIDFDALAALPGAEPAWNQLPKTIAKLGSGEPVTIVAWGDSVTAGGGLAKGDPRYQEQFATRLRERFPDAAIDLRTAAWGGVGSATYMNEPPGSEHNFILDVLEPKPDLVTIEFVNDAYLDEAGVMEHYEKILNELSAVGAEVVLITPHLVRPDWLHVTSEKVFEDPRPYVKGLKEFAKKNNLAVADASAEWCRLWRKGIPYMTLLGNSINHPDVRGHRIFADVLIGLFPADWADD